MKNKAKNSILTGEILIPVILIVLVILCTNPFDIFMPSKILMILNAVVLVVFVIYAFAVWREKPLDEREAYHASIASRFAYIAGSAILIIAFISEEFFTHQNDPWIVLSLVVMIFAKLIGFVYAKNKH